MNEHPGNGERLWKSQQEEDSMVISRDEVYAWALRRDRNDARVGWALAVITPLVCAAYVYNLTRFGNPWMILGAAWGLFAFCYFVWISFRDQSGRQQSAEPCVAYTRRLLESKRSWTLKMRRTVLLSVPAVVFTGWGRLHDAAVQNAGPLGRFGPLPFIAVGIALALVWTAMLAEDRRLAREIARLGSPYSFPGVHPNVCLNAAINALTLL